LEIKVLANNMEIQVLAYDMELQVLANDLEIQVLASGDCSFYWYWWNYLPSLFKLPFLKKIAIK
jgi:hypothetical protein